MMNPRPGPILAPAALVLALLVTGCSPSSTTARLPTSLEVGDDGLVAVPLAQPLDRPHTDLVGTDGRPFDLAEATAGHPALVFMGYTNCPDICPVHMAAVARSLDQVGLRAGDNFDTAFLGATGTADQLASTAQQLGLPVVSAMDPDADGAYTVNHPGQIIAFEPVLIAGCAGGDTTGAASTVQRGQEIAQARCASCHTSDGTPRVGPTWRGLYGSTVPLSDGSTP